MEKKEEAADEAEEGKTVTYAERVVNPTHVTFKQFRMRKVTPDTLQDLCVQRMATMIDRISSKDLASMDEVSVIKLLSSILSREKLTPAIARVFIDSGHEPVAETLLALDFWNAL